MRVLYLDSSAIVKLIVREPESRAVRRELERWPELASSIVSRVEVPRAVRRIMGLRKWSQREVDEVLDGISYLDIDGPLARTAVRLDPIELRSLDAIHLASAAALGEDLGAIATYDTRLADAAAKRGIAVMSPN